MSRALDDLCPTIRGPCYELLARLVEKKIHVLIVDTLRTKIEQAAYIRNGTSWTTRSKHLAQAECPACGSIVNRYQDRGLSHAIDVCPYETYQLHGRDKLRWKSSDPVWSMIGGVGRKLGFEWGGLWEGKRDLGHFQQGALHRLEGTERL